jgi:hypothetical protein
MARNVRDLLRISISCTYSFRIIDWQGLPLPFGTESIDPAELKRPVPAFWAITCLSFHLLRQPTPKTLLKMYFRTRSFTLITYHSLLLSYTISICTPFFLRAGLLFDNRSLAIFPCPPWTTSCAATPPSPQQRRRAMPSCLADQEVPTPQFSMIILTPFNKRTLSPPHIHHTCHPRIPPPLLSTRLVCHNATSTLGGSRKARSTGHGQRPKTLARSG